MSKTYDQLAGLALFSCIVRLGSLSAAAQYRGQSRSSVSKQLKTLEEKLGARLLQRTTRKLSLTAVGAEILMEAQKIENAFLAVENIRDDHQNDVRGHLKITCSGTHGRMHLIPVLSDFLKQFPLVEVNLQLEDHYADLVEEQIDVAIRTGHLQDSSLIARKLGTLRGKLCASPAFLEQFGHPKNALDLVNFPCLYYANSEGKMNHWHFQGPEGETSVTVKGPLFINDGTALIDAAIAGLGILLIDETILRDSFETGKLVQILPEHQPTNELPVYAVYPAREFLPARTQAFLNFIIEHLSPRI